MPEFERQWVFIKEVDRGYILREDNKFLRIRSKDLYTRGRKGRGEGSLQEARKYY